MARQSMPSALPEGLTVAERKALEAANLEAFPINLLEIRRNVQLVLTEFGKHGFFDEYTVHDFSHCTEMLRMLDWIIPDDTSKIMTTGDWLFIVLACYFHDLGLLITKDEYQSRLKSGFPQFKERLFSGDGGADYLAKVQQLNDDDQERFLYQEFVRHNHGPRIRAWIEGKQNHALGVADAPREQIQELLSKLAPPLKRDLAIVCESHNLDDLDDVKKYRVSQPYGNSALETVNLQYCAVLLRTVDLLQITKQRAPTVLFKIINPTDPLSQREWAKQNAVINVRSKLGVDKDGNPDADSPRDTVEVHAHFSNENGFFGLTSYLSYARQQLRRSNELIEKTRKTKIATHAFPWKEIDDDRVEAEGFLKETFGFELDQAKILDLLTGHTLYNDSNVVIRELVQNAIDAVRLTALIEKSSAHDLGEVIVNWNPINRELEVIDNGTGMTQDIIQKHLLKVGSSRYQDPKFKEEHPTFSSISRFGIGVLSTFMIADTVQIITSNQFEGDVREISLRSVHGKYLIRLLEKNSGPDASRIGSHGTIVRLKLRHSVKAFDVLAAMRQWIIVPGCKVTAMVLGSEPVRIGFDSPKAALENFIREAGTALRLGDATVKVVEKEVEGCTLAFALTWSRLFRDWSFLALPDKEQFSQFETLDTSVISTCIEGIAVESTTPGYRNVSIVALANAYGLTAPKTNVARSSLEETAETGELRKKIYQIYVDQIDSEAKRLVKDEQYSLTWATGQIPYLAQPFVSTDAKVVRRDLQREALQHLPMYLVETGTTRVCCAAIDLINLGEFSTVQSQLVSSAERLVREAPSELSFATLLQMCERDAAELPKGAILCNLDSGSLQYQAISSFEPVSFVAHAEERRVDIRWNLTKTKQLWVSNSTLQQSAAKTGHLSRRALLEQLSSGRLLTRKQVMLPTGLIDQVGLDDFLGVATLGFVWLLPTQPVGKFLAELLTAPDPDSVSLMVYSTLLHSIPHSHSGTSTDSVVPFLSSRLKTLKEAFEVESLASENRFFETVEKSKFAVFDPFAWSQRKNPSEDDGY